MKKDVTHLPSVAKCRKTIPPYVEKESPALPLGHGVIANPENVPFFGAFITFK